jgi:ubiquinol-cytochrome c reductase iron-sulfur subunit
LRRWFLAALVLLLRRRRPRRDEPSVRLVAEAPPNPLSELVVLGLLALAGAAAVGFIVVYALDRLSHQTQLLGLSIGLAFAFLSAAAIVFAHRLVPEEERGEPYPEPDEHAVEQAAVVQIVDESANRISRRRLLKLAAGGAGATLGAALVVPALSLGPFLDVGPLRRTPWRRGLRLVDDNGRPLRADDIEEATFYTAFPAGMSHEELGAPLVIVRLDPDSLRLPRGRDGWAPEGIVAYSKICTHAGCAVSLYRVPHIFPPTAPSRPALICPCHYSTFDPATGGGVLFGPAGRPLPQLPLRIGPDGILVAGGDFSGAIGPSWWGVRRT